MVELCKGVSWTKSRDLSLYERVGHVSGLPPHSAFCLAQGTLGGVAVLSSPSARAGFRLHVLASHAYSWQKWLGCGKGVAADRCSRAMLSSPTPVPFEVGGVQILQSQRSGPFTLSSLAVHCIRRYIGRRCQVWCNCKCRWSLLLRPVVGVGFVFFCECPRGAASGRSAAPHLTSRDSFSAWTVLVPPQ